MISTSTRKQHGREQMPNQPKYPELAITYRRAKAINCANNLWSKWTVKAALRGVDEHTRRQVWKDWVAGHFGLLISAEDWADIQG